MTLRMAQQPTAQPVPPDRLNAAAAAIAAGAPEAAVVAAMSQALYGLGMSTTAVAAAVALAARTGPLLSVGPNAGPATARAIRAAPAWRAAYIGAASQRIQASVRQGATVGQAVRAESGFARAHERAQANRIRAAQAADHTADKAGSRLLEWKATLDTRTTAECAAADGKLLDVTRPPLIGLPGAVHPACRCRAVKPSQRALWVGRTVDGATADAAAYNPGRAA